MSFAPATILAARKLIQKHVPQLSAVELGIVGDDAHANSGTSYHLGKDALRSTSYSIVESSRDRNGLSNAAAALDIGWFKITVKGKSWTLRDLSLWLVAECRAGAADTKDIREIIYSPDGQIVRRWDRLGIRTSGDDSHLSHTHVSWFRDSEDRSKTGAFTRWFQHIGAIEQEDDVTEAELIAAVTKALQSSAARSARIDAMRGWTEEDPLSQTEPKTQARIGGWIRMAEQRDGERAAALAAAIARVDARVTELAARPPAVISLDDLKAAVREVLREGVA